MMLWCTKYFSPQFTSWSVLDQKGKGKRKGKEKVENSKNQGNM